MELKPVTDAPLFASLKKPLPYTLIHSDCVEAMRKMPDASIDAVVCDPPYLLSDTSKSNLNCLSRIIAEVAFPDDNRNNTQSFQECDFGFPLVENTNLGRMNGSTLVNSGIGVPIGSVDFKDPAITENKVHTRSVSTTRRISKSDLSFEFDTHGNENLGDFILQPADGSDTAFCHGACGCFTEPCFGHITVLVRAVRSANSPHAMADPGIANSDNCVGFRDDTLGFTGTSTSVVTGARAVDTFMLRLNLRGGTGELRPAGRTHAVHLPLVLQARQSTSTGSRAGCPSPVAFKTYRINEVDCGTNRTFTLYLPAHVDSLLSGVTRGGFMGKDWDGQETPQASYRFHLSWVREAFRVLKPGGHLLAFGGTRTYHRLACAVEDAGFEIRDSVIWCYGSGFPKSLDVSKALAKTDSDAAKTWEGWGTALKPAFEPVVVGRKPLAGTVAENVVKHGTGALNIAATRIPFTSAADEKESKDKNQHEDFGTEPMTGNVTYGDYSMVQPKNYNPPGRWPANLLLSHSPSCVHLATEGDTDLWACVPGCPVRAMDAQSGELEGSRKSKIMRRGAKSGKSFGTQNVYGCAKPHETVIGYSDAGGASRFFMRFDPNDAPFVYQAKANTKDRNAGVESRNTHPTVKSTSLMQYLCRLVTPPCGVVLDPFMGSGSTGVACMKEGFRFIGIEREQEYFDIAQRRIEHAAKSDS